VTSTRSSLLLLSFISAMVAACAPTLPSTPSTSSTSVPAITVDNPAMTISPRINLQDGQTVVVTVTGFGVGGKVWLSECATAADVTGLGCRLPLSDQPLLVTDDNRTGTATFAVRANAAVGQTVPAVTKPCVDQCVIVATLGAAAGYAIGSMRFGSAAASPAASAASEVNSGSP
jgi:hypothetical protein